MRRKLIGLVLAAESLLGLAVLELCEDIFMSDKREPQAEADRFNPWKSRRRRALMCRVGGRMEDHTYANVLELEAKALEAYARDLALDLPAN